MVAPQLAVRMRHFLDVSGKSQAEVARAIGVTDGAVSHWLRRGRITLGHLAAFATECGVDLSTLLTSEMAAEAQE